MFYCYRQNVHITPVAINLMAYNHIDVIFVVLCETTNLGADLEVVLYVMPL